MEPSAYPPTHARRKIPDLTLILLAIGLLVMACSFFSAPPASPVFTPTRLAAIDSPAPVTRAPLPTPTQFPSSTPKPTPTPKPTATALPTATPIPELPVNYTPTGEGGVACMDTDMGVTCLDDKGWHSYSTQNSPLDKYAPTGMATCELQGAWKFIFTTYSKLLTFDGKNWKSMAEPAFKSADSVSCRAGHLWLSYFQGISHYDGSTWKTYSSGDLPPEFEGGYDHVIAASPDGSVWVVVRHVQNSPLLHLEGGKWTVYAQGQGFDQEYDLQSVVVDEGGKPWVTHWNGLLTFDGQTWTNFERSSFDLHEKMLADAQGRIWLGSDEGVLVHEAGSWLVKGVGEDDQLVSQNVISIAFDAGGRLWLGTEWGLAVFDGEKWAIYHMHTSGLASNNIEGVGVIGEPPLPGLEEKTPGSLSGRLVAGSTSASSIEIEICVEGLSMFYSGSSPCSSQPYMRETTTDSDGGYVFNDLPVGRYVFTFKYNGKWTRLTGGMVGLADEWITVNPGEETKVKEIDISKSD